MSRSTPPYEPDPRSVPTIAPPVLIDESALRRRFDEHADALVNAARHCLGDAANLAPKVVEHVFLSAWRARATLTSEEAITRFLHQEVQRDSARVLSRRAAAQRLGSGISETPRTSGEHHAAQGVFDRELAWKHIQHEINGSDTDAAHLRAAAIGHREAAVHIADISRDGGWLRPALIGAAVLLSAATAVWTLDRASRGARLDAAVTASTARSIEASQGQIAAVALAEGSQVRLAAESRLYVPKDFSENLRAVRVEGAASFQVAPGISDPLVVRVRRATVSATGTHFIVRGYPSDTVATILLKEGSLTVRRGKESRTLSPGQAVIVPDSGDLRTPTEWELAEAIGWTQNEFVVNGRRLADVLPEFERWYRLQIFAADMRIVDRPVRIRASLDSVQQAIAAVEESASVTFGYVSDKRVFTDAGRAGSDAPKPKGGR